MKKSRVFLVYKYHHWERIPEQRDAQHLEENYSFSAFTVKFCFLLHSSMKIFVAQTLLEIVAKVRLWETWREEAVIFLNELAVLQDIIACYKYI